MSETVYYRLYFGRREYGSEHTTRPFDESKISWYEYPIVYVDDRKILEKLAIFMLIKIPGTIGVRIEESKS